MDLVRRRLGHHVQTLQEDLVPILPGHRMEVVVHHVLRHPVNHRKERLETLN